MKNGFKNFVALGVGLLLVLVFLELGLRGAGWIFQPDFDSIQNNAFRILCIGDSSTYGTGVQNRREESYPALLETLLNLENHQSVQTINLGLPGINSTQALERTRGLQG